MTQTAEVVSASKSVQIQSPIQGDDIAFNAIRVGSQGTTKLHKPVHFPLELVLGCDLLVFCHLRETQFREFYSTTEEITDLFTKQKEQLKAMQRALEDEDDYANLPFETEENPANGNYIETMIRAKEKVAPRSHNDTRHSSATSTPRVDRTQMESTSNDDNVTEKHECDPRNQEEHHTQDLECTSADSAGNGAFGSDIDGVGTVPELEGDTTETESMPFTGDRMQLDEDIQVHETEDLPKDTEENAHNLLTSEVAGSWAMDTVPSVHGENDSPRSEDRDDAGSNDDEAAGPLLCLSGGQAAGSRCVNAFRAWQRQSRSQCLRLLTLFWNGWKLAEEIKLWTSSVNKLEKMCI